MSNASPNPNRNPSRNPKPNDNSNDQPPAAKRQRLSDVGNAAEDTLNVESSVGVVGGCAGSGDSDLGKRLQHLLLCVVCQEVPHPDESYQCSHGHIMCDDCKTHILADARIKSRDALCPSCRVVISNKELEQNLVVRQALWELPICCPSCDVQLSEVKNLSKHLKNDCEQRVVRCKYHCLGCDWEGTHKESVLSHDACCGFPQKTGKDILELLLRADAKLHVAQMPLMQLHRKLSASRVNFVTLKMKWIDIIDVESPEDIRERTLESQTISAFEEQWVLRLHLTSIGEKRAVSCQLLLMTTPRDKLMVDHMIQMPRSVCSVNQQQDIRTRHYRQLFDLTNKGGGRQELPLVGQQALYRLFAMSEIYLRLWMFLHC
ncbi:cysteine and histidine-rich protein 1 homolog [Drosophila obscura]|uniref:cysteine and histidine-rich protein 1 homolog n=1 Tax=Drosophila obscura TaxID=7282 RepID=UPI001BB1D597|nr:cysteine and histidine-rich protein 1 homolog [Drosophila obscura]